jgi:YbbR domain-containing protein
MMTAVDYEPKTIEIAGEDLALSNINSLTVNESIVGANQNIEKEINLQEQLPEGLILVGDNQTVTVDITIVPAQTKDLSILPDEIEIRNKPANMDVVYITTGPVIVTVFGPVNEITGITNKSVKPYIDLSNYSSGTYNLGVGIEAAGNISLVNNPTVSLYLNQK